MTGFEQEKHVLRLAMLSISLERGKMNRWKDDRAQTLLMEVERSRWGQGVFRT